MTGLLDQFDAALDEFGGEVVSARVQIDVRSLPDEWMERGRVSALREVRWRLEDAAQATVDYCGEGRFRVGMRPDRQVDVRFVIRDLDRRGVGGELVLLDAVRRSAPEAHPADAALHERLHEIEERLEARRLAFGNDAFTGGIHAMSPPQALLDEQQAIMAKLGRRRKARAA